LACSNQEDIVDHITCLSSCNALLALSPAILVGGALLSLLALRAGFKSIWG
jgi:hypothetical protein